MIHPVLKEFLDVLVAGKPVQAEARRADRCVHNRRQQIELSFGGPERVSGINRPYRPHLPVVVDEGAVDGFLPLPPGQRILVADPGSVDDGLAAVRTSNLGGHLGQAFLPHDAGALEVPQRLRHVKDPDELRDVGNRLPEDVSEIVRAGTHRNDHLRQPGEVLPGKKFDRGAGLRVGDSHEQVGEDAVIGKPTNAAFGLPSRRDEEADGFDIVHAGVSDAKPGEPQRPGSRSFLYRGGSGLGLPLLSEGKIEKNENNK